jgi:phage baseplate assembly protein gpV
MPQWLKFSIVAAVAIPLIFVLYQSMVSVPTNYAVKECIRFADELKQENDLFAHSYKVEPGKTWTKSGAAVVQMRVYDKQNSTTFRTRLCVINDDTIKIVSALEHWRWE